MYEHYSFMFLNVLKDTIYYDVSWHNNIEVLSNSSLRSGNAGLVPRMKIARSFLKGVSSTELCHCGTPSRGY